MNRILAFNRASFYANSARRLGGTMAKIRRSLPLVFTDLDPAVAQLRTPAQCAKGEEQLAHCS
jgi:hypothetical protein